MLSRSGKKAGKKGNARNKNRAKATSKALASPDIELKFEDLSVQPSPLESGCEEEDEIHHASSRPANQTEILSSGSAHSRKRSHSLPSQSQIVGHCDGESASAGNNTANDSRTRTEAISLLRARTLSRSSDSGQPSQESLQFLLENKSLVSAEETPGSASEGTMAFMKASLLDFMSDKPKKNKSKVKKRGKNVPIEEHGESSKAFAKNDTESSVLADEQVGESSNTARKDSIESNVSVEEQAGESSKTPTKDHSVELPPCEKDTSSRQESDEAGLAAEEWSIRTKPSDDTDKGKGKQRVGVPEPEASSSIAALSASEPSPVQEKVDAGKTVAGEPETPSYDVAALPLTEPSPEQESIASSKAATEGCHTSSEKDATVPSYEPLPFQMESDPDKATIEEPKTPTGTKDFKSSISPSEQSAVKHTNSKKEKLPAIKEGEVQHDSIPISGTESPVLRASTPESTGTATNSTAWTPSAPASTPQTTTAASAPSTDHRTKAKGKGKVPSIVASPAPPPSASSSSSQVISSHAHPSPSTSTFTDIQHRGRGRITSKKPPNFFWQLDSHCFPCARTGCPARCNLWDGATVICPKCGPYSETRYCSRAHLLQDIKAHWPICGQAAFTHPCKESTIPRDVREAPPLIPCLYGFDTPERHRQAVHFNMNHREGDYFIFSDWVDMVNKGALKKSDNDKEKVKLRCSSRIIHAVRLEDPQERDRFRRVLAAVLFVTIENPAITDYLYRLIRDHIRSTTTETQANPLLSLESSLKYQMNKEFAITIQPYITGKRHACPTDWTGRSRRSCTDEVCRSEHKPLLGQRTGGGHKMRIEELESSYWILRAARITHPTVENAMERMTGKGFMEEDGHFGVEEDDRRVFCRGDGWDGLGAGDMEIEGVTC
ncbi:hypothetical protein BDW75DRAFT_240763 [Aspergillus navahoensis]